MNQIARFLYKRAAVLAVSFLLLPITLQAQPDKDLMTIRGIVDRQQQGWNDGDLEQFMEGYWKSDSLQFIGSKGITYGWQTTLDHYKKGYPTPEAMGTLTFNILTLEKLSDTTAWMVGTWHLKRATDEPSGHFTLLWKKIKGTWVIVADHSS